MKKQTKITPVASALGVAFAGSMLIGGAQAGTNPFGLTELDGGYMQVASEGKCGAKSESEGKCGGKSESEGKCGGKSDSEGKCGQGRCGSSS